MDFDAAGSVGVHQTGVDAVDFVADFPGGTWGGYLKARFAENCVVGSSNASGFAGSAGGVGAGDDFTSQAVAADDFIAEVPGGDAAGEDYFIKDMKLVVHFDGANGTEGVDVEVKTKDQRQLWNILYRFFDVVVAEVDRDEAG